MSTHEQPREGEGTSSLEELAAEDSPVVTDPEDDLGTRGDPDAVDSVTGRKRAGHEDGAGIADVAAVSAGGGLSGATGNPGLGVPLTEEAREEGDERASDAR